MIPDVLRALRQTFSPPFRRVLWISLALALVTLFVLGVILQTALGYLPQFASAYLNAGIDILLRFFAVIVLIPLVFPVTTLVAAFFLESMAGKVEAEDYPADPAGRDQPFLQSLIVGLRFTAILIVVNICALPFYLLPGVNLIMFWAVNGYLLGREYFELVALRHLSPSETRVLRKSHRLRIFLSGVLVALFASVPLLNLAAPLFGTAFLVHTYKRLAHAPG
ncbi:MAG: EI24 domain-containing protein [Parvibaculaceae bacterium]|nr:EI24 domain-containing protein [Parvibaculaceae bacterium]